jgi:hypothetical protein
VDFCRYWRAVRRSVADELETKIKLSKNEYTSVLQITNPATNPTEWIMKYVVVPLLVAVLLSLNNEIKIDFLV